MSKDELATAIPIKPPTGNKKIKPKAYNTAGDHLILLPWRVTSQLYTSTPVGEP